MEQNLFSVAGMSLTDEEVRSVYELPLEGNINKAVLDQHMAEAIKHSPEDEVEIRKEYHYIYRLLLQKMANKGLLKVNSDREM